MTCGGLCPGLNVVIREITMCLRKNYGVQEVYGIKWGFRGFYEDFPSNWIELTEERVETIHNDGGTILGSSRGGFDADLIIKAVLKKRIDHIYCVGGDGTHRGIAELAKEIRRRRLKICLVGVPKTIDNDIPLIDYSFGFETAVRVAEMIIETANREADAAQNGVGLVKLMGRHAGYIAQNATLASRDVNFCLVPEIPFELYG